MFAGSISSKGKSELHVVKVKITVNRNYIENIPNYIENIPN